MWTLWYLKSWEGNRKMKNSQCQWLLNSMLISVIYSENLVKWVLVYLKGLLLGHPILTHTQTHTQTTYTIAAWSKPLSRPTDLWAWESILMALSLRVIVIMCYYCGNSWLSSIEIHSTRLKVEENKKTLSEQFPSPYSCPSQQFHLPMGIYFH